MTKYDLTELINRWEREELTVEQAVGQILLWLRTVSEQVKKVELSQRRSQQSEAD